MCWEFPSASSPSKESPSDHIRSELFCWWVCSSMISSGYSALTLWLQSRSPLMAQSSFFSLVCCLPLLRKVRCVLWCAVWCCAASCVMSYAMDIWPVPCSVVIFSDLLCSIVVSWAVLCYPVLRFDVLCLCQVSTFSLVFVYWRTSHMSLCMWDAVICSSISMFSSQSYWSATAYSLIPYFFLTCFSVRHIVLSFILFVSPLLHLANL